MAYVFGGMAELVDALDSKSCGLRPCQFKSDYPYQIEKLWIHQSFFHAQNSVTVSSRMPHL